MMTKIYRKCSWIVLILSMLNLVLTRRIYSMVDVFAVICMRNNTIMKKLPPELPIPFREPLPLKLSEDPEKISKRMAIDKIILLCIVHN